MSIIYVGGYSIGRANAKKKKKKKKKKRLTSESRWTGVSDALCANMNVFRL
jgi:hypothetical protein